MTARTEWTSAPFVVAGITMTAIVAYSVLAEVGGLYVQSFAVTFAVFGCSVIAAVVGLLRLSARLARHAPILTRVGAGLAALAGLGALSWVVLGLVGLHPWVLPEPYAALLIVGSLAALLVALPVFGLVMLRAGVYQRAAGALLLASGLVLLGSVAGSFGWRLPEWLPPTILATWGLLFLAVGLFLRGPSARRAHHLTNPEDRPPPSGRRSSTSGARPATTSASTPTTTRASTGLRPRRPSRTSSTPRRSSAGGSTGRAPSFRDDMGRW